MFTLGTDSRHAVAGPLTSCGGTERKHGFGWGQQEWESGYAVPVAHALRAEGFDASEDGTGRGTPIVPVAYACQGTNVGEFGALRAGNGHLTGGQPFVASAYRISGNCGAWSTGDHVDTLSTGTDPSSHLVAFDWQQGGDSTSSMRLTPQSGTLSRTRLPASFNGMQVRRLTPTECERLQGFPPGFTDVPFKGKPASDGPRYRALGNSMAVPCVRWILSRIEAQTQANAPPDYLRATRQ